MQADKLSFHRRSGSFRRGWLSSPRGVAGLKTICTAHTHTHSLVRVSGVLGSTRRRIPFTQQPERTPRGKRGRTCITMLYKYVYTHMQSDERAGGSHEFNSMKTASGVGGHLAFRTVEPHTVSARQLRQGYIPPRPQPLTTKPETASRRGGEGGGLSDLAQKIEAGCALVTRAI